LQRRERIEYPKEITITGNEEQISAMAMATKAVKNETTIHPQTRGAGPPY